MAPRQYRNHRVIRHVLLSGIAVAALAAAGCGATDDPKVASADPQRAASATPRPAAANGEVAAYLDGMRAWVGCLRGEGLEVSDPDPTGIVTYPGDPAALKADPKFQAAQKKCRSVQPPVPESVQNLRNPKLTAEQIATQRRYADCMQRSGAPDFPDPGSDGYPARGASTWNQTSAGARRATVACASIIGDPTSQPTTQG